MHNSRTLSFKHAQGLGGQRRSYVLNAEEKRWVSSLDLKSDRVGVFRRVEGRGFKTFGAKEETERSPKDLRL